MAEQDTSRLGDALGINRGLDTKTVPTILGGLGKRQDLSSRAQYAREQLPDLTGKQMEEEFAARVGLSRAEQTGLRGDVEAARTKAIQQAGLYEEADTGQKEYQKFEAPKYTTDEYVGDAAKRLLMGLLMGGVGKVSSINQLRAIKTMQEAEDANQMDRYSQALRDWEQNEKARLDHNKRLKERIENALKLSETDYNAAMAEAKLAAAQAKEGTIAADLNQMKLSDAIKKLEAIAKLENETQARLRVEAQKAAQKATRPGQLPTTLQKTLESTGKSRIAINRAFTTKKNEYFGLAPNDAVANLILSAVEKGIPVGDFGKRLGFDLPEVKPETVNWWKDYITFVSLVRNELFGATLTKPEQEAFRQFTISPATDPKVVDEYFKNQLRVLDNAARRERAKAEAFGASDQLIDAYLDVTPRERTPQARPSVAGGPKPPEFASIEEADAAFKRGEIQVGDEIRVGGRKAEYTEE